MRAWQGSRHSSERRDAAPFFKSLDCGYRRIRKRPSKGPPKALYEFKVACLSELEGLSEGGEIDLFYGDESGFCTEGYVPYGWQFKGERVSVPVEKTPKGRLNCFGMISRDNRCHWSATAGTINGEWLVDYLETFSLTLSRKTVLVLDCAALHRCRRLKERLPAWRRQGLWLFYLPPYSPHLNLCETLWRVMKGKWLAPQDYQSTEHLHYAATSILNAVGNQANINFQSYNSN